MEFRIAIRGAVVVGLLFVGTTDAFGQTSAKASGNWTDPATWTNGVPNVTAATTPALIDGDFNVTMNSSDAVGTLVDVGSAAGQTGNLTITDGLLLLDPAGAVAPAIRLGQAAGATGNLTMSGGTVFINSGAGGFADGDLIIGDNGTGTMTMTGGTFDADDEIFLGFGAGSSGTLNVSGGTISTLGANMLVGFSGENSEAGLAGGHGEVNLSGTGKISVANWMFTSFDPGSSSTINQSGGTLAVSGLLVHGTRGDSTYNHSGGAVTAFLGILGDNFAGPTGPRAGAHGTYNLSGSATLDTTVVIWVGNAPGAIGTLNQDGGTANVGALMVGRDGTGEANLSSGSMTVKGTDGFTPANHLIVGMNELGSADENLSQGTGVFHQTGGTITVRTGVFLGNFDNSEGTYKISGGTLNVAGGGSHGNPESYEDFIGDFSVGGALASNARTDRVAPANPGDPQGQALAAKGTFVVSGSAATINIAGNFLANPADKHANRRNTVSDLSRDNSATLGFEIFDNSGTSLINVAGVADLDGAVIDLDLMNGFNPTVGKTFDLLRAASFGSTGSGTTQNVGTGEGFTLAPEDVGLFDLAVIAGGGFETLRATFLGLPGFIAGDFDGNGSVGNSDLTLLLDNWGDAVPPVPAGWTGYQPTPGAVGNDELTALLDGWGDIAGAGSLGVAAVPEPTAWLLLAMGAAIGLGRLRRKE